MRKTALISKTTRVYKELGKNDFHVLSLNIDGMTTGFEVKQSTNWVLSDTIAYIHLQPLTVRSIIRTIIELNDIGIDNVIMFKQYTISDKEGTEDENVYTGTINVVLDNGITSIDIISVTNEIYMFKLLPTPYTEISTEEDFKVCKIYALAYADVLSDVVGLIPEAMYSSPGQRNV